MTARIRKLLSDLSETFWLIPGLTVVAGVLGALALVGLDRRGVVPQSLIDSPWLYNGGACSSAATQGEGRQLARVGCGVLRCAA